MYETIYEIAPFPCQISRKCLSRKSLVTVSQISPSSQYTASAFYGSILESKSKPYLINIFCLSLIQRVVTLGSKYRTLNPTVTAVTRFSRFQYYLLCNYSPHTPLRLRTTADYWQSTASRLQCCLNDQLRTPSPINLCSSSSIFYPSSQLVHTYLNCCFTILSRTI